MSYVGFVVEKATFSPTNPFHKTTMELTKSFPPADALVEMIQEVDYKKLWQQFVIIAATIAAFVMATFAFVYRNVNNWYQNGGKEQLIRAYNFVSVNIADLIDDVKERVTV